MAFAPYQWRSDGGYQPSPIAAQPTFYPFCFPWANPLGFVNGPVPVHGVISTPPPAYPGSPFVQGSQETKKSRKKGDEAEGRHQNGDDRSVKEKLVVNPEYPPALAPGMNYMFPSEHTILHIFNKAAPIWDAKYKGQALAFKIFKVSTSFTVANVIERVVRGDATKAQAWAATEVVERGDGVWSRGTTIEYKSDKAKGSLSSMGWTAKRGDGLPPVWVVVHKVEQC